MPYLKYYKKENREFKKYSKIMINRVQATELINSITKHFSLPKLKITFNKRKHNQKTDGSYAEHRNPNGSYYKQPEIELNDIEFDVLLVLHEVAHHKDSWDNGQYHKGYDLMYGKKKFRKAHTKKHRDCLIELLSYYDYIEHKTKYDSAPIITL